MDRDVFVMVDRLPGSAVGFVAESGTQFVLRKLDLREKYDISPRCYGAADLNTDDTRFLIS